MTDSARPDAPSGRPAPRSERGEATRQTIATAAQELFLERGYDGTTMRAVADRAGVSLGNAYYYFASKDHLIQAFYDHIQDEHEAAAAGAIGGLTGFGERLRANLLAWVEAAEPYHGFAAEFFKNAAEPTSPLSPFSDDSEPSRARAVALMARVLDGSDLKVAPALRSELPELLWLLQMGMVLFWVHDRSEHQRRTRALATQVVPLVDRLARLTRLPGVRSVADDLVAVVRGIRA